MIASDVQCRPELRSARKFNTTYSYTPVLIFSSDQKGAKRATRREAVTYELEVREKDGELTVLYSGWSWGCLFFSGGAFEGFIRAQTAGRYGRFAIR